MKEVWSIWSTYYGGAVAALREQWWLIGSDTRLRTEIVDSNPAISQAYSGLLVLRWAAIWDGTLL